MTDDKIESKEQESGGSVPVLQSLAWLKNKDTDKEPESGESSPILCSLEWLVSKDSMDARMPIQSKSDTETVEMKESLCDKLNACSPKVVTVGELSAANEKKESDNIETDQLETKSESEAVCKIDSYYTVKTPPEIEGFEKHDRVARDKITPQSANIELITTENDNYLLKELSPDLM